MDNMAVPDGAGIRERDTDPITLGTMSIGHAFPARTG